MRAETQNPAAGVVVYRGGGVAAVAVLRERRWPEDSLQLSVMA